MSARWVGGVALGLALIAVVSVPARGRAQTVPANASTRSSSASPPQAQRDWYGYQTLIVDAATMSAIAVTLSSSWSSNAFYGAYAAYVLGAPIVHVAHLQGGMTIASLFLRLTVPVLTFVAFVYAGGNFDVDEGEELLPRGVAAAAFLLGFGIPVVVDAWGLAWEPARPAKSIALRVGVDPQRSAALLSVAGTL